MNLKYAKISTWSEHFALQNVACKQAIGFIFPIHYKKGESFYTLAFVYD